MNVYAVSFAIVGLLLLGFHYVPLGIWFTAKLAGLEIPLLELLFMRFRKSPVSYIVKSLIAFKEEGIKVTLVQAEAHTMAGGDLENIRTGMVAAREARLNLTFEKAADADLAGIDLLESVQKKINQHKRY
jgi:uncharacterized protein YqfA (UPF0365 family)